MTPGASVQPPTPVFVGYFTPDQYCVPGIPEFCNYLFSFSLSPLTFIPSILHSTFSILHLKSFNVDHFPGHAAVNDKILAGDKARAVRQEERYQFGNIIRQSHPAGRVLAVVGRGQLGCFFCSALPPPGNIDPARADAVHPHHGPQAYCQCMGK